MDTNNEMLGSWLIQRLQKPYKRENPFAFGGGLENGGLSKEAMELLKKIFRFDYMGSAEFEFGSVPQALQKIAKESKDLVAFEVEVKTKAENGKWRDQTLLDKPVEAVVYVICHKKYKDEVEKRIKKWAQQEPYGETKEGINLNRTIRTIEDKYNNNAFGWLELDNGFMFFTDKEMFEKTCKLFEVK